MFRIAAIVGLLGCRAGFDDLTLAHDAAIVDGAAVDAPVTAIAFAQHGSSGPACRAVVASCSATLPTKSVAGDLLLVAVTYDNLNAHVSTVTDTVGNTYTTVIGPITWPVSPFHTEIWSTTAIPASTAITLTATFSLNTTSFSGVVVSEYVGATAIDQTSVGKGNGGVTMVSSGSRPTSRPHELIFGHGEGQGPAVLLGPGFTQRDNSGGNIDEDKLVTATGPYDAEFGLSNPGEWIAFMVTLE